MSNTKNASKPSRSLLRRQTVLEKCGFSKATLYRLMAEGKFPKSVPLFGRSVAWYSDAVQAWIDERIEAPRSATW